MVSGKLVLMLFLYERGRKTQDVSIIEQQRLILFRSRKKWVVTCSYGEN